MKRRGKMLVGFVSAIFVAAVTAITAFAETLDYDYDMTKSRWTYGGGQSYTTYTRLDVEKRDKNNFNPMWMTEDSQIIITYETEGEATGCPTRLSFQTWQGELVSSQETRACDITPDSYDDTTSVYSYKTMLESWGKPDFSDVYSIVVWDSGTNNLFVNSMKVTNLNVPEEDLATVKGGVFLKDGEEFVYTAPETETTPVESEVTNEESVTEITENTEVESTPTAESKVEDTKAAEEEESGSNTTLIIIIAVVAVVVIAGVIIIVKVVNNRNHGWH